MNMRNHPSSVVIIHLEIWANEVEPDPCVVVEARFVYVNLADLTGTLRVVEQFIEFPDVFGIYFQDLCLPEREPVYLAIQLLRLGICCLVEMGIPARVAELL
ncbi:uncharacterized protein G2W53_003894 [Senna tora]|uniref:Uncharacterized protein n=1 Tax=Senna tora TaxID=362788 RepID=A0A834XB85_9FABA|nr:uncharacterized protein G2W53_003894 [Senna tora]